MCDEIIHLKIVDNYTEKVYERLKLKKEYFNNKDDIIKTFDSNYILYNPKIKKIFKQFTKAGKPMFTEQYKYAKLMNLCEAYISLNNIIDIYTDSSKYINKILEPITEYVNVNYPFPDITNSGLKVCKIIFY